MSLRNSLSEILNILESLAGLSNVRLSKLSFPVRAGGYLKHPNNTAIRRSSPTHNLEEYIQHYYSVYSLKSNYPGILNMMLNI